MKGPEKTEWIMCTIQIESEEKLSKIIIGCHISKVRQSEKFDCAESLILKY